MNRGPHGKRKPKTRPILASHVREGDEVPNKMARKHSAQAKENSQRCPQDVNPRIHERLVADKMELARNYYWVDVHDLHKMRPPLPELLAFMNYDYSGETLEDIPHFQARLQNAQRHTKAYVTAHFLMRKPKNQPKR